MKKLAILISGRGSNFLAIADAIQQRRLLGAEIAVVLSNKPEAPGLTAARDRNIPAFAIPSIGMEREAHEAELIARLHQHAVDLVILAGYMRVLSPKFINAFPSAILNIHPSLLPAFPGLDVQQQAIDYGAKCSGCTVHFVDEAVDHGPIILQRPVPIQDLDTAATLTERILEQEHIAYSEAIARVLSGRYYIDGRRYLKRD